MTHNQIIKELLARLHLSSIRSAEPRLWTSPLTVSYATDYPPNPEGLELALGGEAKALWDMVNESPYTPLETELLQRLQMTWDKCDDWTVGDGRYIARACFAPTEETDLEPLQVYFKNGPPWLLSGAGEEWEKMEREL